MTRSKLGLTVAAAMIAVLAASVLTGSVAAHSGYERSEPGLGEVLPGPPARIDVWFLQNVAPDVGGFLARGDGPAGLFALPFTHVSWNIVAGGALLTLGLGAFLIWRSRPPDRRSRVSASVGASAAFAMVAGTVLVFGVHSHDPGAVVRTSPVPATAESLAIGQELFQASCVLCHGSQGRGDGPGAAGLPVQSADLGLHVPYHNDGTFFLWISEGIPVQEEEKNMPAFKSLFTEEQRWHIVNFLREAFNTGTFEPVVPEDPAAR